MRILWVDSDVTRSQQLRAQLPPKYALTAAASGQEAMALLSRQSFWLAVINHGLTDTEELELIAKIKRHFCSTRLMFCSDSGDFRLGGAALELGVDALAARSCSANELLGKLKWLEEHPPSKPAGTDPSEERLKRIERYVSSHIKQPFRQEQVLQVACLSRSALHRYFKRLLGMSYSEYVSSRRIERAKHLLAHDDAPIYEIAAKTGFQDPAYFCRWFKQLTTVTPLSFRNAARTSKQKIAVGALVPLSGAYGNVGQDVLLGVECLDG